MAKIVKPSNLLKQKVGSGGFKAKSIQLAQTAIEENEIDFAPIALGYLQTINDLLSESANGKRTAALHASLLDPLMQLRAQGSLFHYPSVTAITDIVVDLLDSLRVIDADVVEIIRAYEMSARVLVTSGIKHPDHKSCLALSEELKAACKRYRDKH